MDDDPINIVAYIAAAKAGVVAVPVSDRLQPPEVEFIIGEVNPGVVLYSDSVAERLTECQRSGSLDDRVLIAAGRERLIGSRAYAEVLSSAKRTAEPRHFMGADETFLVAFSSGTTGRPKGAMLTGTSIREIAVISSLSRRLGFYNVGVSSGSLSFPATIMATVLTHIYMGGGLVLMGRGWDVDELLSVVQRVQAAYVNILSPHAHDFASAVQRNPSALQSVTSVMHGGSKIPRDDMVLLHQAVGPRLIEVWGMVENSGGPLTATCRRDYSLRSNAVDLFSSVGRAVPQCQVEVIDSQGAPLPHDGSSAGELVVSSPALMRGYWNRPKETAEVLHDGQYHTGDIGAIDSEGFVYILDRRNDLIVSGGANIYPSEIERVLLECPRIREAVVVGVPHERWGHTPAAVLILEEGTSITEAEVLAFLHPRMASYKKPTKVLVVSELPRNVSGKIVRSKVRSMVLGEAID
jgi:acyl-CoA synthetase (AMP-forming)/AMP-acid ligase II